MGRCTTGRRGVEKQRKAALSTVAWCVVVFFFFQAEDGIRDYKVTGVQTCALPIYFDERAWSGWRRRQSRRARGEGWARVCPLHQRLVEPAHWQHAAQSGPGHDARVDRKSVV